MEVRYYKKTQSRDLYVWRTTVCTWKQLMEMLREQGFHEALESTWCYEG